MEKNENQKGIIDLQPGKSHSALTVQAIKADLLDHLFYTQATCLKRQRGTTGIWPWPGRSAIGCWIVGSGRFAL
jgi:hypothetical protein